MTKQLADLASMYSNLDTEELVWENGPTVIRDPFKLKQRSAPCSGEYPSFHLSGGQTTFVAKAVKSKTADPILDSSWFCDPGVRESGFQDRMNSYPKQTLDSSRQGGHLSERCSKDFNVVMVHNRSKHHEPSFDFQTVPLHPNFNKQGCSSNFLGGISGQCSFREASAPVVGSVWNLKQTSVSPPDGVHGVKLQQQNSGLHEKKGRVNFSLLLGHSTLVPQANNNPSSNSARPTGRPLGLLEHEACRGNDEKTIPRSSNHFISMPTEKAGGARCAGSSQEEPLSTPKELKQNFRDCVPKKESIPDEHSEAFARKDPNIKERSHDQSCARSSSLHKPKRKADGVKTGEPPVAAASVCSSPGASNYPSYTSERTNTDADNEQKEQDSDVPDYGHKRAKRKRSAEVHNLSEKKRREKINKKMRALQELIPNCNKVDKASMLDEAIEYLKILQLQVQMMSMGTGVYVPPMMLPAAVRQMSAPQFANFSPVGVVGMGMTMLRGVGCNPAQLLTSLSGATAQAGTTEARRSPLGFSAGHVLPSMAAQHEASASSSGGRFTGPVGLSSKGVEPKRVTRTC